MLADGGVGAGIGVKRAEGDCFGDKMIFFYYIKLFVFFICQEDFFNHFAPTAVGIVFHYQLEDWRRSWTVKFGSYWGGKAGIKVLTGTKA